MLVKEVVVGIRGGIAVDYFHAHTATLNTSLTHRTLDLISKGSWVNAVIRLVAINGPMPTFRKFSKSKFIIDQLIEFATLPHTMYDFLRACVLSRLHIVNSGDMGLSKATLVNVLSSFIPEVECFVTIEDSAELPLDQTDVIRMEG